MMWSNAPYLAAKGSRVPARTSRTGTGDLVFSVNDPDGTQIEFSQPQPTSVEAQGAGKFLSPTRVSDRIYHVGFLSETPSAPSTSTATSSASRSSGAAAAAPPSSVGSTCASPMEPTTSSWMLYRTLPATYGTSNHVALLVPDLAAAIASLQTRPAIKCIGQPLGTGHVGHNGKRQLSLFDPDGTRVS